MDWVMLAHSVMLITLLVACVIAIEMKDLL